MRNAYRVLVGIPEEKGQLGKWEDYAEMNDKDIEGRTWPGFILSHCRGHWLALTNTAMGFLIP
jgi:hypothetical protein